MEDYEAFHIKSMLRWLLPFHSKQNPKKYGVQLIGVYIYICKLGVYNLLLRHILKIHYFLAYQKIFLYLECLLKYIESGLPMGP
jgi:hypothetical protein